MPPILLQRHLMMRPRHDTATSKMPDSERAGRHRFACTRPRAPQTSHKADKSTGSLASTADDRSTISVSEHGPNTTSRLRNVQRRLSDRPPQPQSP
jgi:hypothetical protein